MASAQCCKPVDQTCNQEQQHHQSLGEKLTGMVGSVFKKEQTHQTHCSSQTTHQSSVGLSATKTQAHCTSHTATAYHGHANGVQPPGTVTNGSKCHGKTRRNHSEHKKRGLFQKIKDGISGNSDDESSCSSSSSSESDNEDEKCGRQKN